MFLKQYNYKPRSGSIGSQGGNDAAAQAQQATQQQPAQAAAGSPPKEGSISAAAAGRRRSSAGTGGQFAGLQGYKRNSSDRSAMAEQEQQAGVLGQMWNNFTKGK